MRKLISANMLPGVKPGNKPYEIRDTRLPGFMLRVQPSGVISYVIEYGRSRRITLGRSSKLKPAQARKRAELVLANVAQGNPPLAGLTADALPLLGSLIENEYATWARANRKCAGQNLTRLRTCFGKWWKSPLDQVTAGMLERWKTDRLTAGTRHKNGGATINRDLSRLRAVYSFARKHIEGFEHDPFRLVDMLPEDPMPKVRYLTGEERQRLESALADTPLYLRTMVTVSLNTGVRRAELFGLTWDNVELGQRQITVEARTSKHFKTRHVPLNDAAHMALRQWKPKNATGLVFPGRNGDRLNNAKKSFSSLLRRADIENFRWHDMRHDFASQLAMRGIDLNTVRELLGHGDLRMTIRYAHLAPEHKAKAVAILSEPWSNNAF